MRNSSSNPSEYSAREIKSSIGVTYWSLAMALAIVLGCAAAVFIPVQKLLVGILALSIYLGISFGAITAHIRWLKALDEMQRKIQLESMAITLGALWIAFGSLLILNAAKIIYIDQLVVALLAVLAGLVWNLGILVGKLKLR
ncbi:hypothetical protein FKG94_27905 [Exilibacterium tricleocarpae]|uniref:Uncharacterized protein n=1 Tax=Exilibacterium tricleocarpae TaxID=2591008 RepID=A0A545SLH3_9GAMM|nr:hypothetical protein [Exilibacterium tricleocarpae]TQV65833.1 hypothetical protein FKG94_27905 [Exilibacterium tricleocarpae]